MFLKCGHATGIHFLAFPEVDRPARFNSATFNPRQYDLVTRLNPRHSGSALKDSSSPFVAETMRHPFVLALLASPFHHLRATGSGVGHLNKNLPRFERRNFEFR